MPQRTDQQLHDLRRFLYVLHTDSTLASLVSSLTDNNSLIDIYPRHFVEEHKDDYKEFEHTGKQGTLEYLKLCFNAKDKDTLDFYLVRSDFLDNQIDYKPFRCIDQTFICQSYGRKELPDYFPNLSKEKLVTATRESVTSLLDFHLLNLISLLYRTPDQPPIVFDDAAARAAVAAVEQQAALVRAQQQRASQHLGDIRMD